MSRIYKGAQTLIDEHGLDPEKIKGTGSGGAITKGDVEAHLEQVKADSQPSQQDLIRAGLLEGLTNEEIRDKVLEVYPASAIKPAHVSWTLGNERRKESEWWKANRKRIGTLRPGTKGTS